MVLVPVQALLPRPQNVASPACSVAAVTSV